MNFKFGRKGKKTNTKMISIGPEIMKKFRREAFLVIFIVAAVITPPDALTQILVGIPMYILYEISITVAARVVKNGEEKEKQNKLT